MMLRCPIDNLPCGSTGCSFRGGINEQCHRRNYSLHIEITETPIAMEPTKERIKRDALLSSYKWVDYDLCNSYKEGYIAGATCENERSQQELQAYRDIIKELLPLADTLNVIHIHKDEWHNRKVIIDRAKKLIDTVTPT